jgi:hypothetical protein
MAQRMRVCIWRGNYSIKAKLVTGNDDDQHLVELTLKWL